MSKYTTGEIAKLCGVSVRTVQYYDSRNILIPSELSEGGRRLYSEQDLKRMKIICFLRDAGISINSIGELLSEALVNYFQKIIRAVLFLFYLNSKSSFCKKKSVSAKRSWK